jgi:aldehyde dehydrogenase (NAD+)
MGGKNAIIVLEDANLELVTDATLWAAFGTSGQRCTAASRLIIQKGIAGKVKEALVERTKTLRLGNGLEESVQIGPVINKAALERIHHYVQIGQNEGARVLAGAALADVNGKGFFYQPTLFDGVQPGSTLEAEEIFGPVLSIIPVEGYQEAVTAVNQTRYGLSASIFTRDANAAFRAMSDFETGIVYVNAGTTGAETHLPFGGWKETGNGHREAGHAALDTYTEWKSIYVDFSGRLQRAQIDNQ